MGPVLIDEVFAVNDENNVQVIDGNVIIIDNLFKDWTKIRNVFIDAPAFNWRMPKGTRNFIDYYDCRHYFSHEQRYPFVDTVVKIMEYVYKFQVSPHLGENNAMRTNWFKQIKPRKSDWAQIHRDGNTSTEFTMITYLNTEKECSGGTSLFKTIRSTDIEGHTGVEYWSALPKEKMGKILNIEMKPGRTLIFQSNIPHAAWHPNDSFYEFPRHNIVFRLNKSSSIIKKV